MLDKQKGEFVFECDMCGNTLETGTSNFEAARNLLRRERWVAYKSNDDWKHLCDACKLNWEGTA